MAKPKFIVSTSSSLLQNMRGGGEKERVG